MHSHTSSYTPHTSTPYMGAWGAPTSLARVLPLLSMLIVQPIHASWSDPFESFNRTMFSFNRMVLESVLEPSLAFLEPRIPKSVVTAAGNVYANFTEIEFVLNGLLVGDPQAVAVSTGRFAVNSTVGVAGLFDVASYLGLVRTERDFIESVCRTGLPPGPYVVFPLVGPANLYSATALATGVAVEVYLLSFISTTLAMADFILIDIGGTASALRYMRQLPLDSAVDPYSVQKDDHLAYVSKACDIPFHNEKDKVVVPSPAVMTGVVPNGDVVGATTSPIALSAVLGHASATQTNVGVSPPPPVE